jgi:hypothetical protein
MRGEKVEKVIGDGKEVKKLRRWEVDDKKAESSLRR